MSSSKREKRRKKSTKKTALERYAQQKDQSGKDEALSVDFFFLLIGMITTLMTFLLVCSLFTTNPNTTAALEAAKVGDATKEVNATDDEEFDDVLNSSDAAQLTNILRGLNSSSVKVSSGKAVKTNQRRVEVVNHLLTKKLDDEQHKYAVTSKLNALTTIYGLRLVMDKVPDVAESLRSTSKKYLDVTDDDVRKLAHLSLFKVNAFEMAKENKEEIEVQLLVNDMCKLLKKFPNDDLVLGTLDTIVEVYRKIDPDIGLEVTKTLQSREKEFADSPKVAQLIRDYVDETTLDGYQELFNNRWVDGVSGQKQLFEDSLQLISDPSAGALVLKTVDEVAHWFEQDDQYENAVASELRNFCAGQEAWGKWNCAIQNGWRKD